MAATTNATTSAVSQETPQNVPTPRGYASAAVSSGVACSRRPSDQVGVGDQPAVRSAPQHQTPGLPVVPVVDEVDVDRGRADLACSLHRDAAHARPETPVVLVAPGLVLVGACQQRPP